MRTRVLELIQQNDSEALTVLIDSLSSKEIVHLIGHINRADQIKILTLLSPEDAAEVMEDIPEAQAVNIIGDLKVGDAAAILNEMESDEQADLIQELHEDDARAILNEMDPEEAEDVKRLMNYEYDTAGGLMRTEYLAFPEKFTVGNVTDNLRKDAEKYKDYALKYIFVISSRGKIRGVLKMQDMLLASPETRLSKIVVENVAVVHHKASLAELIDFFNSHDLFGVPVVNDFQTLIGVVLRRDILEAESERITQEHLETQGIVGGDELRTMPVLLRARRRLSWLSVNILLNIIAASVIAYHQDVLSSVIALAIFLPIISDMSGCSGNQAVAVSMRELSLGVVRPGEVLRVWWQEISVGLINGSILGLLIGAAALLWKGNIYLGLVVGSALAINTVIAVSIGGTVPLILKGFNIDPALASGPILTTITDMIGFFLALSFAALAIGQLGGL
jgi:magnesium transporter